MEMDALLSYLGGGRFTEGLKEEAYVPRDLHTAMASLLLDDLGGLFAKMTKATILGRVGHWR